MSKADERLPRYVREIIEGAGGKITGAIGALPDGSGACTASWPLPQDHWLYADHPNVPPLGLCVGTSDSLRPDLERRVREAARYAVRTATMNGRENDFDPDALVQSMIVGLLGYYTPDGLPGEGT